jgi:hypothetical protein
MPDDTDDTAPADPVGDAESAAETLHDLIAYLANQSATAATRDPPAVEELADLTGRIAAPSHRRGYQQGVAVTAEGALDRVVEDNGYCDWRAVADLHADRYAPAHDPPSDGGDGSSEREQEQEADHEQEQEREFATDGGVETAPEATLDGDPDGGRAESGSLADLAVRYVQAIHHAPLRATARRTPTSWSRFSNPAVTPRRPTMPSGLRSKTVASTAPTRRTTTAR